MQRFIPVVGFNVGPVTIVPPARMEINSAYSNASNSYYEQYETSIFYDASTSSANSSLDCNFTQCIEYQYLDECLSLQMSGICCCKPLLEKDDYDLQLACISSAPRSMQELWHTIEGIQEQWSTVPEDDEYQANATMASRLATSQPANPTQTSISEDRHWSRRPTQGSHDNCLSPDTSSLSPPPTTEHYGIPLGSHSWKCAFPSCRSRAIFHRPCDLRKHYSRHKKATFCRYLDCPSAFESGGGGFSCRKDRERHEAKHNPRTPCAWEGCGRVFSRVDNMRDHVKRVHVRQGQARTAKGGRMKPLVEK